MILIVSMEKILINVKCLHCNHRWDTASQGKFVTCPSCQLKTRIRIKEVKKLDEPKTKERIEKIERVERSPGNKTRPYTYFKFES